MPHLAGGAFWLQANLVEVKYLKKPGRENVLKMTFLSLLPHFQKNHWNLDYIQLLCLKIITKKKVSNEEKKEWAQQWMRSVWCTWKTLVLFLHCWIELWLLGAGWDMCLVLNGFQKQLEILMEESSATRIDFIIPRSENKMWIGNKHPSSSGNP